MGHIVNLKSDQRLLHRVLCLSFDRNVNFSVLKNLFYTFEYDELLPFSTAFHTS